MDEQLVPGDYTALLDLNIRSQMDTQSAANRVGVYSRGVPFTVYEVYPEVNGIVWGRVSSNTGYGTSRYVGLRVTNQLKAVLEKPFEKSNTNGTATAIKELTGAITILVAELRNQKH